LPQPCGHSLLDERPLHLGHACKDRENQLARRRPGVDAHLQDDDVSSTLRDPLQSLENLYRRTPQAIKTGDDQNSLLLADTMQYLLELGAIGAGLAAGMLLEEHGARIGGSDLSPLRLDAIDLINR
jgi:hypothetical protein